MLAPGPLTKRDRMCGLGISISSLLPGTWRGLWLANLSDSCLLKPGAPAQEEQLLPSALCPLQDPGQRGKSRPPCPPCPTGRRFVPEPPRQCKRSARLCSPGQMHTLSAPGFPPARAHRLTWWFREPRHWTFLNQFDTEKREHLLKTTTVRPKNGQLFRCPYDTQGREAGVLVTLRGRNRDPHPSTSHLDGREGLSSAPLPSAGQ